MARSRHSAAALPVFLLLAFILLAGVAFGTGSDRVAFVRGGNIWIAHTNGAQERQLTFTGQDNSPSLSPDGKWVLYHSGKEKHMGFGQLYLLATEGGVPKKFDIKGIQAGQDPFFSFDGNSFVFVGISNTKAQGATGESLRAAQATISVCAVDLLNLKLKTVVSHAHAQLDGNSVYDAPSCSPDFSLITFQHNGSDGSGGFEVVDSRGKFVFRYPREPWDPTPYWRPRFSPDGAHILCYAPASESGQDAIYLVDIRKGKKRKIAEGANPTFVEGGKAIVFEQAAGHLNGAKSDLFYMKLGPNCGPPKRIIANGSQPSD